MRERERERERETSACIRMSCNLETYVSVLKMILGDASRAHRLLHDKVEYSTVLVLCMLSIAWPNVKIDETFFPEFHSDQIWIRTVLLFEEREDPNITKMAFRWPNVEFSSGGGGGGPDPLSTLWIRAWDRTMYTLIEIY